jgi:hypothetical protein
MKHAECPVVDVTIEVAAAPERVWELVSDIAVIARLSRETKSVEWVDGAAGPAVGHRFRGVNEHEAAGQWTTESTVVVCDAPRAFQWDVGAAQAPAASWGYELQAVPAGTRLRGWGRLGPGPSNLTKVIEKFPDKEERIVARRLEEFQAGVAKTLAGIKALAET